MKHSVTRDFRIKNPQLVEGLEKMDVSMVIMFIAKFYIANVAFYSAYSYNASIVQQFSSSNSEDSGNEIHNSNLDESNSTVDETEPSKKKLRIED